MKQSELNEAQRQAAEAGSGPVVIVAGPGTGKTKTLIARIDYLLRQGVPVAAILALTFTKKAAEEMQDRLGRSDVRIATFHGLCREIIGEEFSIIQEPERLQLIKNLPRPASLKHLSVRELALAISRAKNMLDTSETELAHITKAYSTELTAQHMIDFDDILLKAKLLLETNTSKRTIVQKRYMHILVDEFQDTNNLQYELVQLMRGNDNLFVIGDPLQSIYGFRGANGGIFERFAADFPHAQHIILITNYRSAPEIVRLSNAIFSSHALPSRQLPGKVQAIEVLNEYSEADLVVGEIQLLCGGSDFLHVISDDDRAQHCSLHDIAIVYRSRSASAVVRRALDASGLPYQVIGDGSPYDEPAIRLVIERLGEHEATSDPGQAAATIIAEQKFPLSPALQQFCNMLVQFKTVEAALAYLQQIADQQFYDPKAEVVTLLTIHAAKGLEFEHVFLVGAEEDILPSGRGDIEEEKRLWYVAATRPRHSLTITFARFRASKPAQPSRFICSIQQTLLPRTIDAKLTADQRRLQKRQTKRAQTSLF